MATNPIDVVVGAGRQPQLRPGGSSPAGRKPHKTRPCTHVASLVRLATARNKENEEPGLLSKRIYAVPRIIIQNCVS